MATRTGIQWTEVTWNPTTGCDRISSGCDNCYALALAKRLKAMGNQKYQTDGDPRTSGQGFGVAVHPQALHEPYSWAAPRTVFVNSMSDLLLGFVHGTFYAGGPVGWVEEVFVRPDRRAGGVGRGLMSAFEDWAAGRGCALVALATRRAKPFYLAIGYEESATYLRKILDR